MIIGYIPTIYVMWKEKKSDSSVASWAIWWGTSIVSCLYSGLVVKDDYFLAVSIGHVIGISTILYLQLDKRSKLAT